MKRRPGYSLLPILLSIGTLLAFHLLISYSVLKESRVARAYDEAEYLRDGIALYQQILLTPDKARIINRLLEIAPMHQPRFFSFVQALVWGLLRVINRWDENLMILIVNALFLGILLMSIYGICSVSQHKKAGILSAFLISFFPVVFGSSRIMMLDFPLMSMVTLSIFLLFKTDNFRSRFFSILFGLSMALSQLTKVTFAAFMAAPVIYYFIRSFKCGPKNKVLLNFALASLLVIAASAIVYFNPLNFQQLETYFLKASMPLCDYPPWYYLRNFPAFTGSFIFVLTVPLFLSYLLNIRQREKLFLLWLVIPLVIYSVSANKALRFVIPVLPAYVLIVTQELFDNRIFQKMRKAYIILLVFLAIFQYSLLHRCRKALRLLIPVDRPLFYHSDLGLLSVKRDPYYPVHLELLNIFQKEKVDPQGRKNILFPFFIGEVYCPLLYKFPTYRLPFDLTCPLNTDNADILDHIHENWEEKVLIADYIVDKLDWMEKRDGGYRKDIAGQMRKGFEKYKNLFEKIAEVQLFDGSFIYVYRKLSNA